MTGLEKTRLSGRGFVFFALLAGADAVFFL
jgi:hypothetical protein